MRNATVIRAFVPLANMFAAPPAALDVDGARLTRCLAHYDVPRNVADEVKAKYA